MDGPLHYEDEYLRNRQKEVALKCLHNSKNISDEFLNEIKAYSIKEYNKTENILSVYGITQNPDTKDYIMVLDYAKDMGLSGKVDNTDRTSIYGVTPYIAPEVLRGEPYTQAADIYSFDFKEVMNIEKEEQHYDIKKQFKESEEYRKAFISSSEKNEKEISQTATHPEAIYTSRILDTLTKELHDECLDCEV
ncbi:unnamed protein product [Rhizophagus irregularis]|uniref:Protein kinase domain-containing protein n=1 Tax=Rhizophagus irregularis TaxID=588596 RepID=A0A915ZV24_9GLOM|nr:unnamed protein product [Rhizophagus irregularis]